LGLFPFSFVPPPFQNQPYLYQLSCNIDDDEFDWLKVTCSDARTETTSNEEKLADVENNNNNNSKKKRKTFVIVLHQTR
jgi:hypothetical protein